MDWAIFKHLACIDEGDSNIELYSCCDEKLQSALYTAYPHFLTMREDSMLHHLNALINRTRNRPATRKYLQTVVQQPGEGMIDYSTRVLQAANDCHFVCHACHADLTDEHARDQLMIGLSDATLQKEIMCRDHDLPAYADVLRYCTTYDAATSDLQTVRLDGGMAAAARAHPPPRARHAPRYKGAAPSDRDKERRPPWTSCRGCGATTPHVRSKECPAWGKPCRTCKQLNHFEAVCLSSKDSSAAHVSWDPDSATFQPDTPRPLQHVTADI